MALRLGRARVFGLDLEVILLVGAVDKILAAWEGKT